MYAYMWHALCACLCVWHQEMEREAAVATWRRLTASCHAKQQQLSAAVEAAAAAASDAAAEGTAAAGDSSDIDALKVGAKGRAAAQGSVCACCACVACARVGQPHA